MCMYKKLICVISFILVLGLIGNASAADVRWDGGGGADQLWSNAANWDAGVPGPADTVRLDGTYTALIDSTVAAETVHLYGPGVDLSGLFTLNMTGGTLDVGGNMEMTYGAAGNGLWNMSGGTVNIAAQFWVSHAGVATINMTGGTINVSSAGIFIPKVSGGTGHVDLHGGTINANDFWMRESGGVGTMDITEGTLIIDGDKTSKLDGYVSSGWITAYNGTATVNIDYNVTNPGKTTVAAIDEGVLATNPVPADGTHDVPLTQVLSWDAPADVLDPSYDVYLGTNPDPPLVSSAQTATSYDPDPDLVANQDYYWVVDVIDGNTIHEGLVWQFDTKPTPPVALLKGPYLLYPGVNTQMTVLWQLDTTQTCALEWGTDTTYSDGSTQTTEYGNDHQHKHTITNLTQGTKYYYRVTVGQDQHTGSFLAAPADPATSVKFLAYGDTRSQPSIHDSVNAGMIDAYTTDPAYQTVTLHSGDWVNSDSETDWATEYFNPDCVNTRQFQSEMAINGCRGNHEGAGSVYAKYWPYPYVNSFYWSFDYGPVHVAVVDQYVDYSPGSAQYNWLESDLDNSTKSWKFILLHQPGYSAGGHADDKNVQDDIQPLCELYDIQMVFAGHNHYYARCDKNGVKHITTGGGGAPLYDPNPTYSEFVEVTAKEYHFCKIDISGTQLDFYAVKPDGTVIDSFILSSIPCEPTDCHVESIVCDIVKGTKGNNYGQVTVTIYNDCSKPVADVLVDGTFTGDFNETIYDVPTDVNGKAVFTTSTQTKQVSYTFCVDDATHATLPYDSNDNLETCDSY